MYPVSLVRHGDHSKQRDLKNPGAGRMWCVGEFERPVWLEVRLGNEGEPVKIKRGGISIRVLWVMLRS